MEFNEKLQKLRKQKGLTQEELSRELYVSRTAVSKWESGRGYPNIDSLKAIARFFSVTVDELLSGGEVLNIAEEDKRQREKHFRALVFGVIDCSAAMLFIIPFFGMENNGVVRGASLLSLDGTAVYLKAAYFIAVIGLVVSGIVMLALQNCNRVLREKSKVGISLGMNTLGALLFIVSRQPYAAVYLFMLLVIKALILVKRQ